MELVLIRHAESEFNAKQSLSLDSRLSTKGLTQAYECGLYVRKHFSNFQIITSPFVRTWQTAHLIHFWGLCSQYLPIKEDFRLREHIYAMNDLVKNQFPLEIVTFDKTYVVDEIDTEEKILERLKDFWNSLDKNGKYIIISHGTPIQMLREFSLGNFCVPKWDRMITNASITHIINNEIKLDKFTGHLKDK